MPDRAELRRILDRIDGRGYGAYKELYGTWRIGDLTVEVEKVQADPYAPPTRLDVRMPAGVTELPDDLWSDPARKRALQDHLTRLIAAELDLDRTSAFRVDAGGQEVLERSTCDVGPDGVRSRIAVELPAKGRRIRGREAADLLLDELPAGLARAVPWSAIDRTAARAFVAAVEDQVALRDQLTDRGLVAFVADGAVLPRRSGVDDRPLDGPGVVPFASPGELRREVELPHAGTVAGMGVPIGVTLVIGGGFHGKSTLLEALSRGVYDHVPDDGRELVVTRDDAVKIRAEDGRRVARVDISGFVGELPTGDDTADFSTPNASGSTSQAANIVEALEVGAGLLLIDEDTAATNLMVRDRRMQQVISADREPLTPFVDLVRSLHHDHDVSTVLVAGGSGDYFEVADVVVAMDTFRPQDVTEAARSVADRVPGRRPETGTFPSVRHRVPDPASIDARRGKRVKTKPRGTDALGFGRETIDLAAVEQLVDRSQTAGIASALLRLTAQGHLDGETRLASALDALFAAIGDGGIDVLRGGYPGDVALPRRFEVAAALNRLRSLEVRGFT